MTETPILDESAVSEIEARANAATVLPPDDGSTVRVIYHHGGGRMYVQRNAERHLILDSYSRGDSEFYFYAREYVSALCPTVRRLRAELERGALCEECEQWEYNEDGSCRTFTVCGECWNAAQSQLEQLRAENQRLKDGLKHEW